MTLCIGQLHPTTVYMTGFWVCVVLVLNVIRCSFYYFLDIILFHHDFYHDSCDCYWDFMAILYFLNYTFRLSVTKQFWFCKFATPWMFPALDIHLEYWFEHTPPLKSFRSGSLWKYVNGSSQNTIDIKRLNDNDATWVCIIENIISGHLFH